MNIKDVLSRIGYVRNKANLSAREVSLRLGMNDQYVSQVESGKGTLSVPKLLEILEICDFPVDRFFANDIENYEQDNELYKLILSLPADKRKDLIDFLK